jgi:CheY-like chemotaxis protein
MQDDEQGSQKQRLQKAFHRFNNLLVTIMGSATLGKRETKAGSDAHRHFTNLEDASRQAAELIQEIRGLIGLDEREEFEALVPQSAEPGPPVAEEPAEDFVLVVDDDATIRDLLVRMLHTMGRNVVAAETGQEALSAARRHPSSLTLALVDLTMPGMNGEQVYLELRQALPDLRIIMMSGYGENASLSFLEGGASEFLQKPFTLAELRDVVEA